MPFWVPLRYSRKCILCVCVCVCVCVRAHRVMSDSFEIPLDCCPPGFSIQGIFQARILEWAAISSSRGSFLGRDRTSVSCISCIGRQILAHWATRETPTVESTSFEIIYKYLATARNNRGIMPSYTNPFTLPFVLPTDIFLGLTNQTNKTRTFLVVQWLRIHLAVQGIQVQFLVGKLRSCMSQSN